VCFVLLAIATYLLCARTDRQSDTQTHTDRQTDRQTDKTCYEQYLLC